MIAAILGPMDLTQFSKHSISGNNFLSVSLKLNHFLLSIAITESVNFSKFE